MIQYIVAVIVGATLFRLGGWGGWLGKAPRRYILPVILGIYLAFKKKNWKQLAVIPFLVGAFSLGYGEKHPYWYKFLVGCAWVGPRYFFLGFAWFPMCVPFIWVLLFWLSNKKPFSNVFKWWIVEPIVGGLIGVCYA